MRVVLDTNIIVSALISSGGKPAAIVGAWLDGKFTLLTCAMQLQELRATLQKPRVAELIKPHKAGRLVNHTSRSSPRTSRRCLAWSDLPTPLTTSCWACPKLAKPITS